MIPYNPKNNESISSATNKQNNDGSIPHSTKPKKINTNSSIKKQEKKHPHSPQNTKTKKNNDNNIPWW